jgi:hypothetical protein
VNYIDEICQALVRVLTRACEGPPHRFVGYAANVEFWAAEARHCLNVIAGYEERFKRMRDASTEKEPPRRDWSFGPHITTSTKSSDRSAARQQVLDACRRFLKRCEKVNAVPQDEVIALCGQVGIEYPP